MFLPDRRRVLVPPISKPLVYQESLVDSIAVKSQPGLSSDASKIYLRTSLLADSAGSAYLEHQQHKILAVVNGPRSQKGSFSPSAKLLVDVKFMPLSSASNVVGIQQGGGHTSSLERSLSEYVYASVVPSIRLTQYPKSGIAISVVVISGSPSAAGLMKQVAAACVTVAGVALVDAGIELTDIVTGCAVKFGAGVNDKVELDLDSDGVPGDRPDIVGRGVVSYMAGRDEITGFWFDDESPNADSSNLVESTFVNVVTVATDGAKEVRKIVNSVLLQQVQLDDTVGTL
ncbi:3' exoribonuclease family, domain 1-domain-containing protein [Lipomyces arxii]|uniref:3' exoribonuclease family, domain 1-domain-containing protein n=1 Tax=Lipomyces arxii TaxID=56418 RepID=UPI0034CE0C02